MFMPLAVAPMNVPLSSVTIGPATCFVGAAAKTVVAAAQIAISDTRRKAMMASLHRNWYRVLLMDHKWRCIAPVASVTAFDRIFVSDPPKI